MIESQKGKPLFFHYGGSTRCSVFRPKINLILDNPGPYGDELQNNKVNSLLAFVI